VNDAPIMNLTMNAVEEALAKVAMLDIHTHLVGGKLGARGLHDVTPAAGQVYNNIYSVNVAATQYQPQILANGTNFIVKITGLYKLTVSERLYVVDTNRCLKALALPPVTVDVKVKD